MIKLVAAVSAAALVAGIIVTAPGVTSQVQAHMMSAKGDRLDLRTYGTACSEHGWPYFETSCLRNIASPTRQAREVRLISTDRLPLQRTAAR